MYKRQVWTTVFQNYKLLNWSEFSDAFKVLSKYNGFWTFCYSIVVLWTFCFVVTNTGLLFLEYSFLVLITSLLGYFFYDKPLFSGHNISRGNKLLFPPFIISLLLIVNFYVPVFNVKEVDVNFERGVEYYSSTHGGGGYHESTEVFFENGDFEDYFLIRFFPFQEELEKEIGLFINHTEAY